VIRCQITAQKMVEEKVKVCLAAGEGTVIRVAVPVAVKATVKVAGKGKVKADRAN